MYKWISARISLKVAIAFFLVLTLLLAAAAWLLVRGRDAVLRERAFAQAETMAMLGAETVRLVLEQGYLDGAFTPAELFAETRTPGDAPPAAAIDNYLDRHIRKTLATMCAQEAALFALPVERSGQPSRNSLASGLARGAGEGDRALDGHNFADAAGLAAARFAGAGRSALRQEYRLPDGDTVWEAAAPVFVQGRHWGAFRVGLSAAQLEKGAAQFRDSLLLTMGLLLVVAFVALYVILHAFVRPLRRLTQVADRIADGQLEEKIEIRGRDEIGQLANAFNRMTQVIVKDLTGEVKKSSRLIARIKEAIRQLTMYTGEIMGLAAQQATGAKQQASAVQEATTTATQMTATARQVAENSARVERQAEQANAACGAGMQAVSHAVTGMGQLREQVLTIAEAMGELGENSRKIGGIVDIIDEISDQTNLLSLNAAIEAAGAGEAGKRFAIVAYEVKRLAERTVDATGQIKGLVGEIRKATDATIVLSREGTQGVDAASALVGRVSESFQSIIGLVRETAGAAREIRYSTQQQTLACEQMADTIVEVRDVAAQVALNAQETSEAIAELNTLAAGLQEMLLEELQAQGKEKVQAGARLMERVLMRAVESGRFTVEELFDENYQLIPGTDPPKYHTVYDRWLDEALPPLQDAFLQDGQVYFAVLVDRNGYLPTHNTKFSQPLTGDREKDLVGNRTKRKFDQAVGLNAARNREGVLVQLYDRDTGEKMLDLSAPVFLCGRHWGAFRLGFDI